MASYRNQPSIHSSTTIKGHENILKMRQGPRAVQSSICRLLPESRCNVLRKSKSAAYENKQEPDSQTTVIPEIKINRVKRLSFIGQRRRSGGRGCEEFDYFGEHSDDSQDDQEENAYGSLPTNAESYKRTCKMLNSVPVTVYYRECGSERVNISSSQLRHADIKAISISLMNNLTIKHLNISNNDIGNKGSLYLAEGLKENIVITHLNLSHTSIDVDGLGHLTPVFIKSGTLQSLNLSGNGFGIGHAKFLADIIADADTLIELDLSYNNLDAECGVMLGEALASYSSLKKLNLKWNHLRQHGALGICSGLEINDVLEELNIAWNGFGGEGTLAMSKVLLANSTLKCLDLTSNRIDQNSLQFLLEGLAQNDCLEILKIGQNPITTLGAIAIVKAIEKNDNSKLTDVYLTEIPINKEFVDQLKEIEKKYPQLKFHYPEDIGYLELKKSSVNPVYTEDPVIVLFQHMKEENLRIIDLFRTFDTDNSHTISKEEFRKGFASLNIPLSDSALDRLMSELDMNENTEVEFSELKLGHRMAIRKMSTSNPDALTKLKRLVKEALSVKNKPEATTQAKAHKLKRQTTLTSLIEDVLAPK